MLLLLFLAPAALGATRGMVFSSNGDPVAGARVTVHRPAMISVAELERAPLASATSGEDGSFTLDPKVSGVLEVRASHDGYAPAFLRVLSSESDLAIELAPAPTVRGRVNAGGAYVIASMNRSVVWWTRADEQGAFAMADPRGWCSELTVVHPDYAPVDIEVTPSRPSLDITLIAGASAAGTVVTANGRPVKNARVIAGRWRETTTGDDGTFTLRHIDAGVKTIVATDGPMRGTAPRREKDVTIRIESKHTVTGTVRDADKRPLGGVTVTAYETTSRGQTHTTFTDERGNYGIPHCDAADHMIYATAAGGLEFQPEKAKLRNASTARIDLTAKSSTYLTGIVVDERRKPVAGATVVYAVPQMPIAYAFVSREEMMSTRTGADGRFRLPQPEMMERFEFRLQAMHRRYALALTDVLTAEKRRTPITITLPEGIETAGIVVDAQDKPVSSAGVVAVQDPFGAVVLPMDSVLSSRSMQPFVTTDAEGKFTLHLNPAPHDLGVWKEGYAGFRQGDVVPRKGAEPMRIVLDRGVEIRGRVTRKGWTQPFSGTVIARGEDASVGTATVGGDGAFAVQSLRPGSYTLLYGENEGATAEKQVTAPATDVVLELPAVGEVRGRVIDKATGHTLTRYLLVTSPARSSQQIEDEETFMMQLEPGIVELQVRADGFIPDTREVNVEIGKTAEVTFQVVRGRAATGRVVAENGGPIADASVTTQTDDAVSWTDAQTDEDGEFRIEGLSRDRVMLNVRAGGFVPRTAAVEAGELDARVDVVLSRGRSARGRVITSDGAPVEGASVWTYSGQSQQATTAADGTFVIEGLADDRITVSAAREGLGMAQVADADISQEIVITIDKNSEWGSIHGKVKGFVEGGWMYGVVDVSGPTDSTSAPIGRDGKYRIARIAAGEVEVRAVAMTMRGNATTPATKVTVTPNSDIELDLQFRTDIVIRGTVIDSGTPAVGRRVVFTGESGNWSTTTGEGGAYELAAIEPGMYDVSVESRSSAFRTRYQVTSSSTFDIRIEHSEIQGRVIDDQGAPLGGVKIEVTTAGTVESVGQDVTDASGAFAVRVFRGAHIVTATKKDFATVAQQVDADPVPLILKMTRSNGLRVRLVDARSGQTLDGYVVATDSAGMNLARLHEAQSDGSILMPLSTGSYRISASADGFASQSVRTTVPLQDELRIALTPGGTLIVNSERATNDVIKLVMPNGEEYVRCQCNGIAMIHLAGTTTRVDNVAPGQYTLQVLDESGMVKASYPVAIAEGQITTAAIQ